MNTDTLISTLTSPPCNWQIIDAPANVTPAGGKIGQSPEAAATLAIKGDGSGVTMRCQFAPDTPAQTATRNLMYLLTVATVFGGNDGYQWLLSNVQAVNAMAQGMSRDYTILSNKAVATAEKALNGLVFHLTIDKGKSITTLEVRDV